MRILYLGTPADAVLPLSAIHGDGHEIVGVVSQPDRRRGRGAGLDPSLVKVEAERLGLPVFTPDNPSELISWIEEAGIDLGVVVAYGKILSAEFLATTRLGFLNLHYSLLPKWRGAAPVERAILAGDETTGVCVMQLELGLDTGPVWSRSIIPIGDQVTAGDLRDELTRVGANLLVSTLPEVEAQQAQPTAQDGEPSYAAKLSVEEFELDFDQPAGQVSRLVRAGNPRPGAWTTWKGSRIKILRALNVDSEFSSDVERETLRAAEPGVAPGTVVSVGLGGVRVRCGGGSVVDIGELQPAGKPAMPASAWASGAQPVGSTFGE